MPAWADLAQGARPPEQQGDDADPGEWAHGWQRRASRTRNRHFRERELLPSLPPAHQALLRSQAGPHAGALLAAIPSDALTTLAPTAMLIALRRRLRLPLPLCAAISC